MPRDKEFEKALQEAEDPKNIGQGSWSLPRNATAAEKTKYELCEKILGYQEDNNLSDEAMARKLHLTQTELEDILFCRIRPLIKSLSPTILDEKKAENEFPMEIIASFLI
ncbi:5824_t:CDS:2 [Paraglomus occultum]|uniref:5824_t:CDS:1 n=1 Tax=Paraglomus occultum TaxID=144539 RepID=A0A9N9D5I1_9GLOM|nr:5824_t:CDS:2 [Paraglomus occultum]